MSSVDNGPVKDLVADMVAGHLSPKSIKEYVNVVKAIVASCKDAKTRKPLFPVVWDDEYLDMPVVKKRDQHRPAFDGKTISAIAAQQYRRWAAMLFVLFGATGLRAGEALGLEIDKHFADDFKTILVRQKVRHCKVEPFLKTDNAYRDVDLHSSVAAMLKNFIGERRSGFLFCTKAGKPLSDSDILHRHLYPALKRLEQAQAGHHAFRRFRVTWLRKQRCPIDLRHFWLGHAGRSVEDDYDQLRNDFDFRKEIVEKIGLGFDIPTDLGTNVVPKMPSCTEISAVGLAQKNAVSY